MCIRDRTHAGCDQGVPRLLSLLTISPDALQPLAVLLSKSVGAVGPPSLAISRACQKTLANSATAFDDAAPSCCALAEKDSRPSPPLPSLPGGVCDLSPDEGLESVLLSCSQQLTAHSFDGDASVNTTVKCSAS